MVHPTSTANLRNYENLRPNRYFRKEHVRSFSANQVPSSVKVATRNLDIRTLLRFYPFQIRQPHLSLERKQQQAHRSLSHEQKTRMVLAARQQPLVTVRAFSGAPVVRKPLMNQTNICSCGKLRRSNSTDNIAVRIPARGLLPVRSASADPAMSPRRGRTMGIGVKTYIAQGQRIINPETAHGRGKNGTSEEEAARQPLHKGPKTEGREWMKKVG